MARPGRKIRTPGAKASGKAAHHGVDGGGRDCSLLVALWLVAAVMLLALRWIDPPTTAVQMERRMQSWTDSKPYHKRYEFVPLEGISRNLQHAVVAAEDARFYQHHGFDWHEIQAAADEDREGERMRGASTLTQQLVKNLFFGTAHSWVRKGAEASLVPVAELVLGKRRILELYLNVVEWGPGGVFGVEAGCRSHYGVSAKNVGREQAARMAAILPNPIKRRPERMNHYSGIILGTNAADGLVSDCIEQTLQPSLPKQCAVRCGGMLEPSSRR